MNNKNSWIAMVSCFLFLAGCDGDDPATTSPTSLAQNEAIVVFAGSNQLGSVDDVGALASFNNHASLAVDATGIIYVADAGNNKIRKISMNGVVTTIAGSGQPGSTDGAGTEATFDHPSGIAVDLAGNLYVADTANNKVRKITPAGLVTTLAGSGKTGSTDGVGVDVSFNHPMGIAVDGAGSLYVADTENNLIRMITAAGLVTTLAGSGQPGSADGNGKYASFNHPWGIAVDGTGSLYVADTKNNQIRKITAPGLVTTLAGSGQPGSTDGLRANASFDHPSGIAVDETGLLYVADTENGLIRKISAVGLVTTLAESGQSGSIDDLRGTMSLNHPMGIVISSGGVAYLTEVDTNRIYSMKLATHAEAIPKKFNSFQLECQQAKRTCLATCSDTSLPTSDHGFAFWSCVTSCMDAKGFIYGVDC
ncbi:NHL repeat-containing protein [Burkholderia metallica]|uniref:NHL repeat-containing protein n=1 Tax=Burkholderia metallica TaxID=488729 RepID=UPI001CF25341|nr:NHL repeat-containing protein [Burkholderia metallica]MCA8023611.1 hypothetical protein [Burkholderia metallica]